MFKFLKDKEKWEKIRNEEAYEPLRVLLFKAYDEWCKDKEISRFPFSIWFESIKTGNRKLFEDLYFLRRKQLTVYVLLTMIYPEKEEYLIKLQDLLCEILDEHCWSLPAHLPADRLNSTIHIDLFAAETGLYLAEIKYILNDRLHPLIIERITQELDRRIVQSFKNNIYIFEKFCSNWSAVCGGSVGTVLLYENPDVYMEVKPRIEKCMSNYLESIGEDGSVSEGASYWNYGFKFFVLYNDMLKRYTFDRIDYFNNEKVKKLANFFSGVCMTDSTVYSFADSSHTLDYNIGLMHYLNNRFGVSVPPIKYGFLSLNEFSWAIRSFLFYNPEVAGEGIKNGVSYYEKLQCYVNKKDKYAFAIKAGHNKEEHNHNDVGSFVIAADDKQILCDLGAPLYTAYTMSEKAYETVVEKASFGHNVPIVNGKGQGYGREFFGNLEVSENEMTIDMKNAYLERCEKLLRKVKLSENEILLADEFDVSDSFAERFVTESEPEIIDGCIRIEVMTISYNKDEFDVKYEKISTKYHGTGAERIVYLITATAKSKSGIAEFLIQFDKNSTRNGEA